MNIVFISLVLNHHEHVENGHIYGDICTVNISRKNFGGSIVGNEVCLKALGALGQTQWMRHMSCLSTNTIE